MSGTGRRQLLGAALGRAVAAALPALLLLGCATPPAGDAGAALVGRLAITVQATDATPSRSFAADFDLRGSAREGQLRLTGPLGATLAEVRWQPGRTDLVDAQGSRRFVSLEAMAADLFGEPVPLAALPDWLRGRPWPDAPSRGLDAAGFEQMEWRVGLARFADGIVEARRDRAPAIVLRARLERPS